MYNNLQLTYLTTVGNCSTVNKNMIPKHATNPSLPVNAKTVDKVFPPF